jgi:hypothetical protein
MIPALLPGALNEYAPMKKHIVIAAILITAGIAILVYEGISYTTTEKAIDLGPLKVTAERKHTIPLPPIIGGVTILGGILMLAAGGRYV